MFNLRKIVIKKFVKELKSAYEKTYSIMEPQFGNIIAWCGQLVLENIANSDALYHDMDHTIMVSMVAKAIIEGKHICEGGVSPRDWIHYMMAVLCHDIGYVKGVCRADRNGEYATGIGDTTVKLPPGGTDAALTPYHVNRSKLFIQERFGGKVMADVDADRVASYIEITRMPSPEGEFYQDTAGYAGLVRAADFIGQLGDPDYLRKIPALFYEFEETGANKRIGYKNPGDMRENYAKFYWNVVSPYIQDALQYLRVTQEGKQWITNLHSHVFDVEHSKI